MPSNSFGASSGMGVAKFVGFLKGVILHSTTDSGIVLGAPYLFSVNAHMSLFAVDVAATKQWHPV